MKTTVINFVVSSLETIAVIGFLLFPFIGLIAGGQSGVFGAVIGLFLSTILGVVLFGGLFLLIQNNQTLKDIRGLMQAKQNTL